LNLVIPANILLGGHQRLAGTIPDLAGHPINQQPQSNG
jgi:hypothetical protein